MPYEIPTSLLREGYTGPGTVLEAELERAIPTRVQILDEELPQVFEARRNPGDFWFLVTLGDDPQVIKPVTGFDLVPGMARARAGHVQYHGVGEAGLQDVLEPYQRIQGNYLLYQGPNQPCWRSSDCILIQEFPRLSLPVVETQLMGTLPVRMYRGEIPGMQPIQLDGKAVGWHHRNTIYLTFTPLNETDRPYLVHQTLWSYLWKYAANSAESYLAQTQVQIQQGYRDLFTPMITRRTRDLKLIEEREQEEVQQLFLKWQELIQAQHQVLQQYLTLKERLGSDDAVRQQATQISQLLGVRQGTREGDTIHLYTDPIWLIVDPVIRNIGSYRIDLSFSDTPEIRVSRIQGAVEEWDHPNFYRGLPWSPVIRGQVADHLQELNYLAALQQVFRLLYTYDPDEAGRTVDHFALAQGGTK